VETTELPASTFLVGALRQSICSEVLRSANALDCPFICFRSDGFLAGVAGWNLFTAVVATGWEVCLMSKLALDVVVDVLELKLFWRT